MYLVRNNTAKFIDYSYLTKKKIQIFIKFSTQRKSGKEVKVKV